MAEKNSVANGQYQLLVPMVTFKSQTHNFFSLSGQLLPGLGSFFQLKIIDDNDCINFFFYSENDGRKNGKNGMGANRL